MRPLVVYDGDCGFCRRWVARWRHATGEAVAYAPFQSVAHHFPEVPRERFAEAVHFRDERGGWSSGAEAAFRALAVAPGGGLGLGLYRGVPGFAGVSEWVYRRIARHRVLAGRVSGALWGRQVAPAGERLTAWIFARAFGLVALAAFVSLWSQVIGLVGRQGILPAADFLARTREQYGPVSYYFLPTLMWLDPSDAMLHALCAAGTLASAALALGLAPAASACGIVLAYLSLVIAGQDFLWFQWDSLLIECAVLVVLMAPWRWRARPALDPPPRSGWRLLRWLLFRLMFSSAVVKLASGDPTWRHLTALRFHYETQPLPIWIAWYAHHLPAWFQTFSAAMMFAIEGLAPWLIVLPRRPRLAACAALVSLQLLIFVTGNYGVFNLLAIALCIPLLDDAVWPTWMRRLAGVALPPRTAPKRLEAGEEWVPQAPGEAPAAAGVGTAAVARGPRGFAHRWVRRPIAIALFLLGLVPMASALRAPMSWLGPLPPAYVLVEPLRLVNSYGLFAVMTTSRPEISIEGSDDGATWRAYEFRFKPGDLRRRPECIAPHMPRLDWQMWFAALGDARHQAWMFYFCEQLLQGSPPVLALMKSNPFPAHPPRYLRAVVDQYHFTSAAERRRTGAWWTREREGLYAPVLTLREGRLAVVDLGAPGSGGPPP
jgi:predicted DCC family thiol-disulfide oxidoreductase YuxK